MSGASFDQDFAEYGDDPARLDAEIRADLLQEITRAVGSTAFDRASGMGIESLENESAGFLNFILYRLNIMQSVLRYNARVPVEKQVVVGQDWIDIEEGGNGSLILSILYMPLSSINDRTSSGMGLLEIPLES